jgi:hypothetical protein
MVVGFAVRENYFRPIVYDDAEDLSRMPYAFIEPPRWCRPVNRLLCGNSYGAETAVPSGDQSRTTEQACQPASGGDQ